MADGRRRDTRHPGDRQGRKGGPRPERRPARRPEPEQVPEPADTGCVYGIHPVEELLADGAGRVSRLHFLEGAASHPLNALVARARELGVPFEFTARARLDGLAATPKHQGVVARVAPIPYVELDQLIAAAAANPPGLIVLLDEVSDPRNLGAVMRTAEAAGAHGVVIPKRRAAPATELVAKTSAGAFLHLPLARVDNTVQALERLKQAGYWVYGLAADGPVNLAQADFRAATVLVLGAEGKGLRPLVARHCDHLVRIPLKGRTPSLNVSVAAAVAIFAVIGQREGWGL